MEKVAANAGFVLSPRKCPSTVSSVFNSNTLERQHFQPSTESFEFGKPDDFRMAWTSKDVLGQLHGTAVRALNLG